MLATLLASVSFNLFSLLYSPTAFPVWFRLFPSAFAQGLLIDSTLY